MYTKINNPKHQKGEQKTAKIPIKIIPNNSILHKPKWIRSKAPIGISHIRKLLREYNLNTVCEDASCPNLGECFSNGTATFMVMGDICTRRCPFCDVAHGKPDPLDSDEPFKLAKVVALMKLNYVVITSVDRDDLKDGGAQHFVNCIAALKQLSDFVRIEILTPDFRGKADKAIAILSQMPPHVFNHNLETVPRLYKQCRPGADYQYSLNLLQQFKTKNPQIITKSGLMLGLGETMNEIQQVLQDLRNHNVNMLTLGQYLQPSKHHLPVSRYLHPDEFNNLKQIALDLGFDSVSSAPMVRSSYHADLQIDGVFV